MQPKENRVFTLKIEIFCKILFSWDMEAQGIYIYENIGIGHDGFIAYDLQ